MTPLQELTEANLTVWQNVAFTGWLALYLESNDTIDRARWTAALSKAKEARL